MKTYFEKKDLVKFGEMILSKERKESIKDNNEGASTEVIEDLISMVHNSDIENFLALVKGEDIE